jgi:NAD(P)-dependent dehydrogenase (short-subunit alcohol dehydrogenase family)
MSRTIFITGASGNLGKAVVEKFVSTSNRVIATVSPGKNLPFQVVGDVETVEADVTNETSVNKVIQSVLEKNRTIDAAVLLVGGFAMGNVDETDGTALKKMFSINFETAYFCARPLFEQMQKQKGGRIVLIGARPALLASAGKGMIAYALSKSLLFKLAELLNAEGATSNVITSVVVPGTIDTPQNREAMPEADFSKWVTPDTIAEVIHFAISNSSLHEPIFKVYGNS